MAFLDNLILVIVPPFSLQLLQVGFEVKVFDIPACFSFLNGSTESCYLLLLLLQPPIDVTGKEKKGCPKDVAALFSEDQCNFSGRIISHAKYIFHPESSSLKQIAKNYGHFKN